MASRLLDALLDAHGVSKVAEMVTQSAGMMVMKTCNVCYEQKTIEQFSKHRLRKDGYAEHCRSCNALYLKKWRAAHPDYQKMWRAQHPKYSQEWDAGHRALRNVYKQRYYTKHPLAAAAHEVVHAAVRRGRLRKPEQCSRCSTPTPLHAHHDDYRQPLSVEWLCPPCHRNIHLESSP